MFNKKSKKHNKLVNSASKLIYQKGFHLTSLAKIASNAEIPLGNIYYYFKAKQCIGEAVILKIQFEYHKMFNVLNKIHDPLKRLRLFVKYQYHDYKLTNIVKYGCRIGSLSQEISKQKGNLSKKIISLIQTILSWIQEQFLELGFSEKSKNYAMFFMSNLQGMCLLTNAFSDPNILKYQSDYLLNLINTLSKLK
jgi:AcrR family transcriptional regulator